MGEEPFQHRVPDGVEAVDTGAHPDTATSASRCRFEQHLEVARRDDTDVRALARGPIGRKRYVRVCIGPSATFRRAIEPRRGTTSPASRSALPPGRQPALRGTGVADARAGAARRRCRTRRLRSTPAAPRCTQSQARASRRGGARRCRRARHDRHQCVQLRPRRWIAPRWRAGRSVGNPWSTTCGKPACASPTAPAAP